MKHVNHEMIQRLIAKSRPGLVVSMAVTAQETRNPDVDEIICHLLAIDNRDTIKFEKLIRESGIEIRAIKVVRSDFYEPRT